MKENKGYNRREVAMVPEKSAAHGRYVPRGNDGDGQLERWRREGPEEGRPWLIAQLWPPRHYSLNSIAPESPNHSHPLLI